MTYDNDALEAAAELAAKHINDRRLPDKAIDVIDEAGANLRLKPAEDRGDRVTVEMVEIVVAKWLAFLQKACLRLIKMYCGRLTAISN